MAIQIVPRHEDAPLRGEIIEGQAPFRAPAAIERTPEQDALIGETHQDGIQLMGVAWKQDVANRLNRNLMVSATGHIVQAAAEVERILASAPALGEGTQQIVSGAVSAILQQGAATIQQTTVLGMQTIGEVANKVPTGKEIIRRQEREEEQRRKDEERRLWEEEQRRREREERKPGLLELLFGR